MRYSTAGFLAGIFMLPFVLVTLVCRKADPAVVRTVAKRVVIGYGVFVAVIMAAGLACTLVGAL